MWLLSAEQATRLVALQRSRDLQRIGAILDAAFPALRARLGARWSDFVELGARRAAAYGLDHLLCVARLLAAWVVCGAEFETRQTWAAAILHDAQRSQGAKAFQLCVRILEQLRTAPQSGQPTADEFALALRRLDDGLAGAGTLASLLPRERIRLGVACDVDGVELRLLDAPWRQHYTAHGSPWRREASMSASASVALLHDPVAATAPRWPKQITVLGHPPADERVARLRVRLRAEHRCDAALHPLLQHLEPAGERSLRGEVAADATLAVHAPPNPDPDALPHVGEEDAPQFSVLNVASCGLRERGVPIGQLSTLLAAYDATQHLVAWRREPSAPWQLPSDPAPAIVETRCHRERDGQAVDASAWRQGFHALDSQLQQGLARLSIAWERESGVTEGTLTIEAALLVGSAGITWGWAERPGGIAEPPYMRVEGLLDLIACRLALRFSGVLTRDGSRSLLELSTDGEAGLTGPWLRGPDDTALFAVASRLQVPVRQRFELSVHPSAHAGLAMLQRCGPLQGGITGAVGLEQRPDGPGLRWFVRLNVEPVVAPMRIHDPLLGVQFVQQPLLPAQTLVDWSLA